MKRYNLTPEIVAFLKMVRWAEGTDGINGYRTMFGGDLFDSYETHPNRPKKWTNHATGITSTSTAAGAYQMIYPTWMECKKYLNLPDFSPCSQDQAACYLIERRHALELVQKGKVSDAIILCSKEWASLPMNTYRQPKRKLVDLIYAFKGYYEIELARAVQVTSEPVRRETPPTPRENNHA